MSFAIQPINPQNYVAKQTFQSENNNVIWIKIIATCLQGNTGFTTLSGEQFMFNEGDGVLTCVVRGTNLVSNPGAAVEVGTSLTYGGAIVDNFLSSGAVLIEATDSAIGVDSLIHADVEGLFVTINFGTGFTSGNVECLLLVWIQ